LNSLIKKGLITLQDLNRQDVLDILDHARKFKEGLKKDTLNGMVMASCFFEASTRTRLSFESAIAYLGGKTIGFADGSATSQANKGESFIDTLRMLDGYADGLIMRHPNDGAARMASEIMTIPVLNAGDGANQHPTQTLLDLFSIQYSQGNLDNINLGLMGDLKHSRTVRSLIDASKLFKMNLFLIAPNALQLSAEDLAELSRHGIKFSVHSSADKIIKELDCLYLTRLQKERIIEIVDCSYGIDLELLSYAKPNLKILHPLPRLDELPLEIDSTPFAYYFEQAKNGLFIRQALLDIVFGAK
jgi:aspartate carbamoyltransferase catalytic subunit